VVVGGWLKILSFRIHGWGVSNVDRGGNAHNKHVHPAGLFGRTNLPDADFAALSKAATRWNGSGSPRWIACLPT